jgi:hypothetical protein
VRMRDAKLAAGESAPPGPLDWSSWKLWAGLFAAPLGWLFDLEAAYALAPFVCRGAARAWLFAPWVVAVAMAASGLWLARAERPDARHHRFLAQVGTWLSALFLLLLVASLVPRVVLHPCDL